MRWRSLVVAAVLVAGCQTTSYTRDETSPYYVLPSGSRVVLHQALSVPPEKVGVYIQDGKIKSWSDVNHYHAHCKFEVRERKDSEQQVKPEEFIVTRVVQNLVHSVRWGQWRVADASMAMRVSSQDGGLSLWTYATYIYIASDRQPQVFRLGCGHSAYPDAPEAIHLSIERMRRTLGNLVTLHLPPPGNR